MRRSRRLLRMSVTKRHRRSQRPSAGTMASHRRDIDQRTQVANSDEASAGRPAIAASAWASANSLLA